MSGRGGVAIAIPLAMSAAHGGREIQAVKSMEALRTLGVDVLPLDPWDRGQAYRVLHCFGTDGGLWETVSRVRARGVRIVVSPVLVFGRSITPFRVWAQVDRFVPMRTSFRYRRDLLRLADAVIALTATERRVLETVYGVPPDRCRVIPNGVDEVFRVADAGAYRARWGVGRFVLCVGSIEARKGQLAVLQAAKRAGKPIVFVGEVRPDDPYSLEFEQAVRGAKDVVWHRELDAASGLLPGAYAAADALVLPSAAEGLPLVALEARAAGCPLILSDLPQHVEAFPGALFVRAGDVAALSRALASVPPRTGATEAAQPWEWLDVAREIRRIYHDVAPDLVESA